MKEQKLVLLTAAAALMALAGCNDTRGQSSSKVNSVTSTESSQTTKENSGIRIAYGVVSDNIIRAEVQVKKGIADSVRFDEVKFGAVTIGLTSAQAGDNVVTVSEKNYAKYLKVNDKLFTASTTDDKLVYKNGDTDLEAYYKDSSRTQAELSDFYYALVNNFVYGADSAGARIKGEIATIYSKASIDSTYWTSKDKSVDGSQWKWNIQKIEKALKGKDLSKNFATEQGDDNVWTLDSVSTGATLGSFETYIELAQTAFKGTSKVVAYYDADKLDGRESKLNRHYNCISKVELVVGSDNRVIDAHINETTSFLEAWGAATADSTFATVSKTTTKTDSSNGTTSTTAYYAKYMSVNGTIWTGAVNEDTSTNKQNVIYSSSLDTDALAYYGNDPYRAADYYNAAFTHYIRVSNDEKGTTLTAPAFGNVTATKAEYDCTYWTVGHDAPEDVKPTDANNWWQWNIRAVEKAFVGKDFTNAIASEKAEEKDADGHTYIVFDGVKTGATMTEFETFAEFAHRAYAYLA